jgi:large subunit ribosomal protein L15
MNLSEIKPPAGQQRKKRRIGRGMGSGRGKTAGRGQKGQRSISGFSLMRGFEGGQMPLHRRLPKRGFHNIFHTEYAVINVGRLDKLEGDTFDPASLAESGVLRKQLDGVKVLGSGELTRAVTVRAHMFSESARQKIEAAGGKAEVIESGKQPAGD